MQDRALIAVDYTDAQGISVDVTTGQTVLATVSTGARGAKGEKGDKGDKGEPGLNGTNGTNGTNGINGTNGTNGVGVPTGGTTGQSLVKFSNTNYDSAWVTLTKNSVGLSNVDNTADTQKPVSTAQQLALNAKQDVITPGTTGQYWRGDKTWQTLNADAVPDGTANKAYTASEKTKLAGIADGATANQTDAVLKNRANHTGTQPSSSISDLTETVQDIVAGEIIAGTGISATYDDTAGTLTISATGGGTTGGGTTSSAVMKSNRTVTETPDGTRTAFTVAEAYTAGSLMVFLNGLFEYDFTETSTGLTFTTAPMSTDVIRVCYQTGATSGGGTTAPVSTYGAGLYGTAKYA